MCKRTITEINVIPLIHHYFFAAALYDGLQGPSTTLFKEKLKSYSLAIIEK